MIPTIESIYEEHLKKQTAISVHLPRLRSLATGLDLAVEFGVKAGASSSALLMGARHVISYDIVPTSCAERLAQAAGPRWNYRIQSSLMAGPVHCDLLFIDSLHTYGQCKGELWRHANSVRSYIVFHDTVTFGSVGAAGETGRQSWPYQPGVSVPPEHLGIRPAIDELMIDDPLWRIQAHWTDSHGLLVLRRGRE